MREFSCRRDEEQWKRQWRGEGVQVSACLPVSVCPPRRWRALCLPYLELWGTPQKFNHRQNEVEEREIKDEVRMKRSVSHRVFWDWLPTLHNATLPSIPVLFSVTPFYCFLYRVFSLFLHLLTVPLNLSLLLIQLSNIHHLFFCLPFLRVFISSYQ